MNEQQKNLERDIVKINLEICSINESNGMKNIHLDKDISKITVKHRGKCGQNRKKLSKFCYDQFYDGVHPNFSLKTKWFSILCRTTVLDFIYHEFSDIEESDEEKESWDFKRS